VNNGTPSGSSPKRSSDLIPSPAGSGAPHREQTRTSVEPDAERRWSAGRNAHS